MIAWIIENIACIINDQIIAECRVIGVMRLIKKKKKGKSCSCGCEGCAYSGNCSEPGKKGNSN